MHSDTDVHSIHIGYISSDGGAGGKALHRRWQKVHSYPDIICDTGHNVDGIEYIHVQLNAIP